MSCLACISVIPFQMGAYHTLDLELNRTFTLAKQQWDSVALDRIGLSISYFYLVLGDLSVYPRQWTIPP